MSSELRGKYQVREDCDELTVLGNPLYPGDLLWVDEIKDSEDVLLTRTESRIKCPILSIRIPGHWIPLMAGDGTRPRIDKVANNTTLAQKA